MIYEAQTGAHTEGDGLCKHQRRRFPPHHCAVLDYPNDELWRIEA